MPALLLSGRCHCGIKWYMAMLSPESIISLCKPSTIASLKKKMRCIQYFTLFFLHFYIEGFHVMSTSYQANFASHPTRNRHVGFLLAWHGIGKYNKMSKCSVTFYLVHTTLPNYNSMTRILTHTLCGNFELFCEVNQNFMHFLLFFSIPHHTKRNQVAGQNRALIGAYRVMLTLY